MIPLVFTLYRFGIAIKTALKDPEFEALLTILVLLIGSATWFYHDVEQWSILDSLYFSVVTITTVGYGDLSPHTSIAKIFTMCYLFLGIGVLLSFVNYIAQHTVASSVNSPSALQFFRRKKEIIEDIPTA